MFEKILSSSLTENIGRNLFGAKEERTASTLNFPVINDYDGDEEDENENDTDSIQTTSFSEELKPIDRQISKSSQMTTPIWGRSFSSSKHFQSTKFENSSSSDDEINQDILNNKFKVVPCKLDFSQLEEGDLPPASNVNNSIALQKSLESDWLSIYKISAFAFIDALQFSFFVWSFWPFVQQLDPNISPTFIGVIMAVSGVGEAISAPLFGYWTNRIGQVNVPLLASLSVSICGNLSYMSLNAFPESTMSVALLVSRFLSGAGSGNRGTTLAYIAASSLPTDRTRAMAMCGGGALIGITAGPSIQMIFTWIGAYGYEIFGGIRISMYTAPAFLALFINFGCIAFITTMIDGSLDNRLKCIYENTSSISSMNLTSLTDSDSDTYKQKNAEDTCTLNLVDELQSVHKNDSFAINFKQKISENSKTFKRSFVKRESELLSDAQTDSESSCASPKQLAVLHLQQTILNQQNTDKSANLSTENLKMDLVAVIICMTTRSARMLVTSNVESIGAPYSQLMFNLSESQVLNYSSISQAALGALTFGMLVVYAATNYTKIVSERTSCIGAMIALLAFHFLTFPWSFLPGGINGQAGGVNCSLLSYPSDWCNELRPVNIYVYYSSYIFVFGIALPCLNNSLQSLYSLVLGNCRQGTMQGLNQAVGSLSRILGPLIMSSTFTQFGPRATWMVEIATLTLFLGIWLTTYKRLIPVSERYAKKAKTETVCIVDVVNQKANILSVSSILDAQKQKSNLEV